MGEDGLFHEYNWETWKTKVFHFKNVVSWDKREIGSCWSKGTNFCHYNKGNEGKSKQVGPYLTKKLLAQQRKIINEMKSQSMNGRKYLQILYLIRYEYTSKIHIKNSYNLIVRNNLILKCAEEWKRQKKKLKRHFSKEDIQMANRYLSVTNQRKSNQNHNEVSPHAC